MIDRKFIWYNQPDSPPADPQALEGLGKVAAQIQEFYRHPEQVKTPVKNPETEQVTRESPGGFWQQAAAMLGLV